MLEGIVKTASKITGSKLPLIKSIYTTRTLRKATTIISDSTHPANHLFESVPSGKRFRSIKTRTTCFSNSFYPKAVQTKPPNTKSKEQEEGKEEKKVEKKVCVWGGNKAESLIKVVYTCTINYPPSQLLIFGTGTVAVTNPVKVVLVIGIVCVHVCECAHAHAQVHACVCVCAHASILSLYVYDLGVW